MAGYTSTNTQEFGRKLAQLLTLIFDAVPNNTQVPQMVSEVVSLFTTFSAMGYSEADREKALANVLKGVVDYAVQAKFTLPATTT